MHARFIIPEKFTTLNLYTYHTAMLTYRFCLMMLFYLYSLPDRECSFPEQQIAYLLPAWFTVNLRLSYKVFKLLSLQAGVDNIFDTQYRTFASGINAPGRNFILAVRFHY